MLLILREKAAKRNSRITLKSARDQMGKIFDISRFGGLFSMED